MSISIEVQNGSIQETHSFAQDSIKIGRHSQNDLRITDSRISGTHAEIRAHEEFEGRYEFIDLRSRNGSMLLRGTHSIILQAESPIILSWGDQIFLGDRKNPVVLSIQQSSSHELPTLEEPILSAEDVDANVDSLSNHEELLQHDDSKPHPLVKEVEAPQSSSQVPVLSEAEILDESKVLQFDEPPPESEHKDIEAIEYLIDEAAVDVLVDDFMTQAPQSALRDAQSATLSDETMVSSEQFVFKLSTSEFEAVLDQLDVADLEDSSEDAVEHQVSEINATDQDLDLVEIEIQEETSVAAIAIATQVTPENDVVDMVDIVLDEPSEIPALESYTQMFEMNDTPLTYSAEITKLGHEMLAFDQKQSLVNHTLNYVLNFNESILNIGYYDCQNELEQELTAFAWISHNYQTPLTISQTWWDLLNHQQKLLWVKDIEQSLSSFYLCPLLDETRLIAVLVVQSEQEELKFRSDYIQLTQHLFANLKRIHRVKQKQQELLKKIDSSDASNGQYQRVNILGQDTQFLNCIKHIKDVAIQDTNMLLMGPPGCGKSSLARMVHNCSSRRHHPFIHIHCGMLSEISLQSMLFGQNPIASQLSSLTKDSALIRAQHSSLFLDQIEAMPPVVQEMLLTFLHAYKDQSQLRMPRLILSTHKDLMQEVNAGRFLQELYYECVRFPIHIPPLKVRKKDIAFLSQHFMYVHMNRHDLWINHIQPSALQVLENHDWPGNIRELEKVIEKAVILAQQVHYIEANHIHHILK